MKHTILHVVGAGETLDSVADRYGLDSSRAIWDAPCNAALRRACRDPGDVRPGVSVKVPHPVEKLLRQRLQALYRVKPFLTGLFDEQDRLLERLLVSGFSDADLADTASPTVLLRELNDAIAVAIDKAAHAAAAIAVANQALLQTHWHARSDLAAISDPGGLSSAGLEWLVSAKLIATWRQLWSPERLLARQRELGAEPAARWMARELTTVRSRVLQNADLRTRQTLAAISGLGR